MKTNISIFLFASMIFFGGVFFVPTHVQGATPEELQEFIRDRPAGKVEV